MSYNQFAWYYDSLMEPGFYEDYFHYILEHVDFTSVLELGCGTGTLAGMFSRVGKHVTGIDLSAEMIDIAKENHPQIAACFQLGDMTKFETDKRFDLVLCLCDSLNYVLGFDNQVKVLKKAYSFLKEEGTFIFDIHSPYKMNKIFADYHEEQEDEDFYFYWSVKKTGEYEITHYVVIEDLEEDVRTEEKHIQQSFPPKWYIKALSEAGFKEIKMDEQFQPQQRIVFEARK